MELELIKMMVETIKTLTKQNGDIIQICDELSRRVVKLEKDKTA